MKTTLKKAIFAFAAGMALIFGGSTATARSHYSFWNWIPYVEFDYYEDYSSSYHHPYRGTSLTVYSDPDNSRVYVDGVYRGTTPLTLHDLTTGVHTIRITKDNYRDVNESVYLERGKKITKNIYLSGDYGQLKVISNVSNPEIQIDGDKSNSVSEKLSEGFHTATVSKFGYQSKTVTFEVKTNQVTEIKVELEPCDFEILSFSSNTSSFNPKAKYGPGTIRFMYKAAATGNGKLQIKDLRGNLVYERAVTFTKKNGFELWNGKDFDNKLVKPGHYTAILTGKGNSQDSSEKTSTTNFDIDYKMVTSVPAQTKTGMGYGFVPSAITHPESFMVFTTKTGASAEYGVTGGKPALDSNPGVPVMGAISFCHPETVEFTFTGDVNMANYTTTNFNASGKIIFPLNESSNAPRYYLALHGFYGDGAYYCKDGFIIPDGNGFGANMLFSADLGRLNLGFCYGVGIMYNDDYSPSIDGSTESIFNLNAGAYASLNFNVLNIYASTRFWFYQYNSNAMSVTNGTSLGIKWDIPDSNVSLITEAEAAFMPASNAYGTGKLTFGFSVGL